MTATPESIGSDIGPCPSCRAARNVSPNGRVWCSGYPNQCHDHGAYIFDIAREHTPIGQMGLGEWGLLAPEKRAPSRWKMVRKGFSDVTADAKDGGIRLSLHTHGGACSGPLTKKQARDLGTRLLRLAGGMPSG